jgi:hypothetical protein
MSSHFESFIKKESWNCTDWKFSSLRFWTFYILVKNQIPSLTKLFESSEMPKCGEEKLTNIPNLSQFSFRNGRQALTINPPKEKPTKFICE